jgi:hypothetical protein
VLPVDVLELLELPPLHAAAAVAVATARVTAAIARLLRMIGHLLRGWPEADGRHSRLCCRPGVSKVLAILSTCRYRRIAAA